MSAETASSTPTVKSSSAELIDLDRPRLLPARTHHGYRHLLLLARQLRTEVEFLAPNVAIDLGCGARPYRSLFPGAYVGLDLTSAHGAPDAIAAAEQTPLRAGCADVVLSTQQLEHVDDPARVLNEAARLLRKGGTLLLSTHGVWPYHPDPSDLWRWTEEGLVRLMGHAGFEVERVYHQGELFTTAILLASYPIGAVRRKSGRLSSSIAAVMLVIANSLCAPMDWLLGRTRLRHYASPSYLVVARTSASTETG